MDGLELANRLFAPATRTELIEQIRREQAVLADSAAASAPVGPVERAGAPPARLSRPPVMVPPDLDPHILRDVPLAHIYPYVNLQMLYGKHLGLRGLVSRLFEEGDRRALELRETVEALQREAAAEGWLRAHALYRWFRVAGGR